MHTLEAILAILLIDAAKAGDDNEGEGFGGLIIFLLICAAVYFFFCRDSSSDTPTSAYTPSRGGAEVITFIRV